MALIKNDEWVILVTRQPFRKLPNTRAPLKILDAHWLAVVGLQKHAVQHSRFKGFHIVSNCGVVDDPGLISTRRRLFQTLAEIPQ